MKDEVLSSVLNKLSPEFAKAAEEAYYTTFGFSTEIASRFQVSKYVRWSTQQEEAQHESGIAAVAILTKQYLQQEVQQATITTRSRSL